MFVKYIKLAIIFILSLIILIIPFDTVSAATTSTISLANNVKLEISIGHTRADRSAYYNGERVDIDLTFTNGSIADGTSYTVKLPSSLSGSEYFYFLNAGTPTAVTVNGSTVGSASYDAATGELKIDFEEDVSASDVATLSLSSNIAIKENETTDTQQLEFMVVDYDSAASNCEITVPTTKNGFVANVALSKVENVVNYTGVSLTVDWQALGGLGAGDYFEVTVPAHEDDDSILSLVFSNNETLPLVNNGVTYGTATLNKDAKKIVFNFTHGSTDTNISGDAKFNGSYYLTIKDSTKPRPVSQSIVVYINGEEVEFPVTIGAPHDLSKYDKNLDKTLGAATVLIGRDQPVSAGDAFYRFSWRARANWAGLPGVGEFPEGETMHDVVMTDTVEGPGHYIDMSYFRVHCCTDTDGTQPTYGPIKDLPILDGQLPSTSTRQFLDLSAFLSYAAAAGHTDILQTVPYGDGDPNHVTSFTLKIGDLDKVAVELEYRSYIQEGSTAEIPSFRDYFYQSVMNTNHQSSVYMNEAVLNSTEYQNVSEPNGTVSTDGSANMNSGNLNLKVLKLDEKGNPQPDVMFTLFWNGGSVTQTTASDGVIEFSGMGSGLYKLEETTPVTNYKAIEPVSFKIPDVVPSEYENGYVDLNDTDTFGSYGGLNDVVSYVEEDSGTMIGYNQITNKLITEGSFTVTKVDEDDITLTLNNAKFVLSRENGGNTEYYALDTQDKITWVSDQDDAEKLTTAAAGTFTVENLPYGDYKLIETNAPNDYQLNATPIPITIDKDHKVVSLQVTNEHDPVVPSETTTQSEATESTTAEPSTPSSTTETTKPQVPTTPTDPAVMTAAPTDQNNGPSTGDTFNMGLWLALLGVSLIAILFIKMRRTRLKK